MSPEGSTDNKLSALFTLNRLRLGARGVVKAISYANKSLHQKLLSMGIVEGTDIQVTSVAPLGDPITITARGYQLSLRKSEAAHVEIIPNL